MALADPRFLAGEPGPRARAPLGCAHREDRRRSWTPRSFCEWSDEMAAPGWWDIHRQLQKGSGGADVAALQRKLAEDSGDELLATGVFDKATEQAVKDFQRRNELAQDGIVGPITFSILFEGNYRFQLPHPKLMHDIEWTCWAATESVLQT